MPVESAWLEAGKQTGGTGSKARGHFSGAGPRLIRWRLGTVTDSMWRGNYLDTDDRNPGNLTLLYGRQSKPSCSLFGKKAISSKGRSAV